MYKSYTHYYKAYDKCCKKKEYLISDLVDIQKDGGLIGYRLNTLDISVKSCQLNIYNETKSDKNSISKITILIPPYMDENRDGSPTLIQVMMYDIFGEPTFPCNTKEGVISFHDGDDIGYVFKLVEFLNTISSGDDILPI